MLEIGRFEGLLEGLAPALAGVGVELTAVHTEAGPGLLELNLAARPGLRAADDAAYAKLAVKDLAATLGLSASFMAKVAPGEEGSSGHIHLSCWREGANAFAPEASGRTTPTGARRARGCASARAGGLASAGGTAPRAGGRRRPGRDPRPSAGRLAGPEPDDQLLQAPRAGVVRARQRQLGIREPLGGAAADRRR